MADKYINATKALKALKVTIADSGEELPLMEEIIEKLFEALPAADVVEVKHGEWKNNKNDYPECTNCGYMPMYDHSIDDIYYSPYCPNCGAKMDGEHNER